MGKDRTGAAGPNLVIKVPVGTQVLDDDRETVLLDLTEAGQRVTLLEGGLGGRGNASYKTSTNRAPRQHQPGEAGQEMWVWLRLKLLADVTKGVFEVMQPIQASEVIARAFHLAESGTPGPVAVILPEDIFDEPAEGPVVKPRVRAKPGPRAEDIDALAEILKNAERPLVLVGGAMASTGEQGLKDLTQFAESWALPISPSMST